MLALFNVLLAGLSVVWTTVTLARAVSARMVTETALPALLRRTLSHLEEQLPPDDPALQELKAWIVRSIAELEVQREESLPHDFEQAA